MWLHTHWTLAIAHFELLALWPLLAIVAIWRSSYLIGTSLLLPSWNEMSQIFRDKKESFCSSSLVAKLNFPCLNKCHTCEMLQCPLAIVPLRIRHLHTVCTVLTSTNWQKFHISSKKSRNELFRNWRRPMLMGHKKTQRQIQYFIALHCCFWHNDPCKKGTRREMGFFHVLHIQFSFSLAKWLHQHLLLCDMIEMEDFDPCWWDELVLYPFTLRGCFPPYNIFLQMYTCWLKVKEPLQQWFLKRRRTNFALRVSKLCFILFVQERCTARDLI